ncbi:MAG: hypothetical protein V4635_16620 [Bacteroidota bacterium]
MKTLQLHLSSFILLLVLSGVTAFPLQTEIDFLFLHRDTFPDFLEQWVIQLYNNIHATPAVMLYGTDWLAFAHIIIALFFIPVFLDPVKHKVNLQIGMVACLLIFPLAFVCGPVRNIPFFHQLIDCSFGLFGFLYLAYILKKINRLNTQTI